MLFSRFNDELSKEHVRALLICWDDTATSVLTDLAKEKKIDERGVEYADYYKADVDTVHYLVNPISKEQL